MGLQANVQRNEFVSEPSPSAGGVAGASAGGVKSEEKCLASPTPLFFLQDSQPPYFPPCRDRAKRTGYNRPRTEQGNKGTSDRHAPFVRGTAVVLIYYGIGSGSTKRVAGVRRGRCAKRQPNAPVFSSLAVLCYALLGVGRCLSGCRRLRCRRRCRLLGP